jgi:hypothetical protein
MGRTRFESNRHGMYDGADHRPDILRELDLARFGITRDSRKEDNILGGNALQVSEGAPCDRQNALCQ